MSEQENSETAMSLEIKDGYLYYILSSKSFGDVGDIIAAYVEDHEIGRGEIELSEDINFKESTIKIKNFPEVDAPISVRSLVLNKNIELPVIFFKNNEDIIKNIGWQGSDSKIRYISHDRIDCEVKVKYFSQYLRHFDLVVNGEKISTARSNIVKDISNTGSRVHNISFDIKEKINENDSIKIYDQASNELILEEFVNWRVFSEIFYSSIKDSNDKIIHLRDELRILRSKIDLIASMMLEKHGFERIDIYYSLLNEKIERLALSQNKISDNIIPDQAISFNQQILKSPVVLNASEIEGVGVYFLEVENERQWRWLAPRVTIAFRNVPLEAKTIAVHFWGFSIESNHEGILVEINGRSIKMNALQNSNGWELHIPLSHYSSTDRTNIVHIQFKDFTHPEGDQRLLSAVLSHVQYQM